MEYKEEVGMFKTHYLKDDGDMELISLKYFYSLKYKGFNLVVHKGVNNTNGKVKELKLWAVSEKTSGGLVSCKKEGSVETRAFTTIEEAISQAKYQIDSHNIKAGIIIREYLSRVNCKLSNPSSYLLVEDDFLQTLLICQAVPFL